MRISARAAVIFGAALALAASLAAAQPYPAKSIRLVVDTSPGGITDILARMSAEGLGQRVGQQVVVENKAGASGNLAFDFLVKSPPDGYTLLIGAGGNLVVQPFMVKTITFDPLSDLVPVFNVAEVAHILVVPGTLPVKDLQEFIAYAKARPGQINYGSAGVGSPPHLSLVLLNRVAGIDMVHVPYKGVATAMVDLISGRLQAISIALGSAGGNLKTGALKALATGAERRLSALPDLPTSAEAGVPGWKMSAYFGIFAPKGISGEIVRLLNERLQAVIDDPKARQRLFEVGAEGVGGPSSSFAERLRADYKLWGQVVKEAGIRMD